LYWLFFVQMFISPNVLIQKAASSILAELSTSKECSQVIEQYNDLNQHVQVNFCNQYGQLKTISEISGSANNSNVSIVLQHVTTLMQRLQEHRNQRFAMMQQQQRQQYHYPPQPQQQPVPQPPPMQPTQMDQYGMPPMHHQQYPQMQQTYPPNPQFPPQQYY
jgi:hypothetical protein